MRPLAFALPACLLLVACGSAGTITTTITQPAAATQTTANSAAVVSAPAPTTISPTPTPITVPKPHIIWDPIPFGPERKAQMVEYVRRHYGSFMKPTYRLIDPHVIVIHYTVTPTFEATYNTFAPDTPDPELHELPNTCAHFVIDKAGGIHQLVPLDIMCRHTVGLDWTAIGIEHVGYSDQEILDDSVQMAASLRLVRWLRCRYHIAVRNVIGHNESLSSPYHHEDVPSRHTIFSSSVRRMRRVHLTMVFTTRCASIYRRILSILGRRRWARPSTTRRVSTHQALDCRRNILCRRGRYRSVAQAVIRDAAEVVVPGLLAGACAGARFRTGRVPGLEGGATRAPSASLGASGRVPTSVGGAGKPSFASIGE